MKKSKVYPMWERVYQIEESSCNQIEPNKSMQAKHPNQTYVKTKKSIVTRDMTEWYQN